MSEFDVERQSIGTVLRAYRESRSLTQAELATSIRLSFSRLAQIERGDGTLRDESIRLLAEQHPQVGEPLRRLRTKERLEELGMSRLLEGSSESAAGLDPTQIGALHARLKTLTDRVSEYVEGLRELEADLARKAAQ